MKGLWAVLAELAASHKYESVVVDMLVVPEGVAPHKLTRPQRLSEDARKHLAVFGFRKAFFFGSDKQDRGLHARERFEVGVDHVKRCGQAAGHLVLCHHLAAPHGPRLPHRSQQRNSTLLFFLRMGRAGAILRLLVFSLAARLIKCVPMSIFSAQRRMSHI